MKKHLLRSAAALLFIALSCLLFAAAPSGWFLAGSAPQSYDTGVDPQVVFAGQPAAYLRSVAAAPDQGFGTLMQSFRADDYKGQRVRFSAQVKSDSVAAWAGLWMRIDEGQQIAAFDNMQNRPIQATTDWIPYQVVLDVPTGATAINFGILLAGSGTVWLSSAKFEIVDAQTPVTGATSPAEPLNLDFETP